MGSCNCLKVFAALVGPLAWILQIVAIATPIWMTTTTCDYGLMLVCCKTGFFNLKLCTGLGTASSGITTAAAGLLGFSLALSGLGIIINWVSCCCVQRSIPVAIASGVFYNLGAFLVLVSAIAYAAVEPGKHNAKIGSSFIVAIIAFIFCVVASILIIIGGKKQALEPIPAQVVIVQQPGMMMMQNGQQVMMQQQPVVYAQ